MQISRFPRVRLGHFPTPLEFMPRLTETLGGPRIFIKRDDCSGLGLGGSKVRKLEFNLGEAVAQGCDTLLIHGLIQSNHARLVAAAAAKAGLACTVLLEERVYGEGEEHARSGNILLDRLYGAELRLVPLGTDLNATLDDIAEAVRRAGHRPYLIRGGRPEPTGCLGYVSGVREMLSQLDDLGIAIDHVLQASDAGGAQAGFLTGFEGFNAGVRHLGVSAGRPRDEMEDGILDLANRTAAKLGLATGIARERVRVTDDFVGDGYGRLTPEAREAIDLVARCEGILLDPVYTAKAMAALIAMVRADEFTSDQNILFIHTGGVPALFAYRPELGDGTDR